jgi:hypothetical protein
MADTSNTRLLAEVSRHVDLTCADVYSWPHVRGYLPLLLKRNVVEIYDPPAAAPGRCGRVTFYGEDLFKDLPRFSSALVERTDGTTVRLTP